MKNYVKELDGLKKESHDLEAVTFICTSLQKRKETVPIIVNIDLGDDKPKIEIDSEYLLSYVEERFKSVKERIKILEDAFVTADKVMEDCIKNPIIEVEAKDEDHDK